MDDRKYGAIILLWLFLTTIHPVQAAPHYPIHQDRGQMLSSDPRHPRSAVSGQEIQQYVPLSAYQRQQSYKELRKADLNAFSSDHGQTDLNAFADYLDMNFDGRDPDQEDCHRYIKACHESQSEDICQRTYAVCQAVCELWQDPDSDICQFVRDV